VLILLPPSEGKTPPRRGRPADPSTWSFPELAEPRRQVATAVAEVSAMPNAAGRLEVPAGVADQVAWNLALDTAPSATAAQVYTGVLYDAFGLADLPTAARRRANRWVVVMSALHGAQRLTDRIAPYRFHVCADLPGLSGLEAHWRARLDNVLPNAVGPGLVVDGRSSSYVSFWRPTGELADRWVTIRVPGATHMAKHTRGLVARAICLAGLDPKRPTALADGLRPVLGDAFLVDLDEPARRGAPWTLSVTPPPGPAVGIRLAADGAADR
jgi:cytoplasmic iron level regulating protein YaaA (DUF328/UPF0246 family)